MISGKLILFLAGLAITIFSHPKVSHYVMSRLFNEGVVTPKAVSEKEAEIIRYGGARLGLFLIGIILMLISLIIQNF